jgi:hypothetical protein
MRNRTWIASVAAVVTLTVSGGIALANNCPVLIKQGREAAAKADANDPKVKQAVAKLDEAQKLHDSGKHADSMQAAKDANALLGVK